MTPVPPGPLAEVTRGGFGTETVESRHVGHVVVLGPEAEIRGSIGDPHRRIFPRSAVKPFQATASLAILAQCGRDDLDPVDVAIGWASHRGEPRHLAAVRSLLARSGTAPHDLTCPVAVPEADPGAGAARLHHNCSGKHALSAL